MDLRRLAIRCFKITMLVCSGFRPADDIRVFAYHSVDCSGSRQSISPDQLRRHLCWLREHGYRGLTASEYLACIAGGDKASKRVFITFDDGYENFLLDALPVLSECGFPATVFVPTELVGKKPIWYHRDEDIIQRFLGRVPMTKKARQAFQKSMNMFAEMPLMDWGQLSQLKRFNIDVASHGARHYFLNELSADQLVEDITRSREQLLEHLGIQARLLCYPYGMCNDLVVEEVRQAGFEVGLESEYSGPSSDPYRLGRIGLDGAAGAIDIRLATSSAVSLQRRFKR